MTEFLTMQLYGNLSAWGKVAVGERRMVEYAPTKSAVVGMLGSALGVERNESERLRDIHEGIRVAWLVEKLGTNLFDYHTTQRPVAADVRRCNPRSRRDALAIPHQKTTLSTREYREDGFCRLAVWLRESDEPVLLHALRDALLRPRFAPYLGRRCCPLGLPRDPQIVDAPDPLQAIRTHAHKHTAWLRELGILEAERLSALQFGFEGEFPTLMPDQTEYRRDARISVRPWQFRIRSEHRMHISPGDFYAAE